MLNLTYIVCIILLSVCEVSCWAPTPSNDTTWLCCKLFLCRHGTSFLFID